MRNGVIRKILKTGGLCGKLRETRLGWFGDVAGREDDYVGQRIRWMVARARRRGVTEKTTGELPERRQAGGKCN